MVRSRPHGVFFILCLYDCNHVNTGSVNTTLQPCVHKEDIRIGRRSCRLHIRHHKYRFQRFVYRFACGWSESHGYRTPNHSQLFNNNHRNIFIPTRHRMVTVRHVLSVITQRHPETAHIQSGNLASFRLRHLPARAL